MNIVLRIGVGCLLLGLYASVQAAGQDEEQPTSSTSFEDKKENTNAAKQEPESSNEEEAGNGTDEQEKKEKVNNIKQQLDPNNGEEAGEAIEAQDNEGGKKERKQQTDPSKEVEAGDDIGTQLPFDLNSTPGNDQDEAEGTGLQSNGWTLRYIISMLVVLGIMGGVLYALRKVRTRLTKGTAAERGVRIVGKFPLDRRNNVVLLRIQNEDLLIASGNEGARLLARYPAKEESADGDTEEDATFTLYSTNNRT